MSRETREKAREQRRKKRQRKAERMAQERADAAGAAGAIQDLTARLQTAEVRASYLGSILASVRNEAQGFLTRAQCAERTAANLALANVEVERQLRDAEVRGADRDRLAQEVAELRADDRDVAKLRRRLRDRHEKIGELQTELTRTKALISPKPLIYGKS